VRDVTVQEVSMGFTDQKFPAGIHICYIYKDEERRKHLMARYLEAGLKGREKVACFTDTMSPNKMKAFMKKQGIVIPRGNDTEALIIRKAKDTHCLDGRFVPGDMLGILRAFYISSLEEGFSGARVAGEMSWALNGVPGSERLMEYEDGINDVFCEYPVTVICQYDANRFDDDTLFNVLQTHPFVIIDGQVVKNYHYRKPSGISRQMFLVQKEVFSFSDEIKAIEFLHKELNALPGIAFLHVCIKGRPVHTPVIYSGICSSCRNKWKESDDTLSYGCGLQNIPEIRSFPLQTRTGNYGFMNILFNSHEKFTLYEPYIRSVLNVVSNVIENNEQRRLLDIVQTELWTEAMEHKITKRNLKDAIEKSEKSLEETINAVTRIGGLLGIYFEGHPKRVVHLSSAIASEMGLSEDEIEGIRIMGFLHDIGKAVVPREILSKHIGLSEVEIRLIQTHPRVGYDITKEIEFPYPVATAILQHHEKIDGSGYPGGLTHEQIIPEARILSVVEIVENIACPQMYRPALGINFALEEIEKNKGILYDKRVVDACVRVFREKGFKFETTAS